MKVDGSYGEGGGQILRTTLALSCITGEEVEIIHIRKGRKNPGLRTQHLKGVLLLKEMCNAKVEGARIGSTSIKFSPGRIRGGNYRVEMGTAGSITLLLQTALLPALFADGEVTLRITGGTDVPFAPPVDYYRYVLSPLMRRMGAEITINVIERGYYPEGGGIVEVILKPSNLRGIEISGRGKLVEKRGYINLRNLPMHIADRMLSLLHEFDVNMDLKSTGISRGCGLLLIANYEHTILSGDELCRKGIPAERIVRNALEKLKKEMNSYATVDVHMGDHLITFASVASGETSYAVSEITNHLRTNAWVVEKFGAKVNIEGKKIRIHAYM